MTRRSPPTGHDDLEPASPSAPETEAYASKARLGFGGTRKLALVVTAAAASAIVVAVGLVALGGGLLPPSGPTLGPSASGEAASPCPVDAARRHGSWFEIGGPDASFWFVSATADPFYASPLAWPVHVRFAGQAGRAHGVELWAERGESAVHIPLAPNDDPRAQPAASTPPELAGSYPMLQRLPVPGCWTISAAVDARVLGTAVVRVRPGVSPSLPVGTYRTSVSAEGNRCFAFESPESNPGRATPVTAWLWTQGGSDDCTTTATPVTVTTATIEPGTDSGYDLVLQAADVGGALREVRVELHVLAPPEAVPGVLRSQGALAPFGGIDLSADYASVFFVLTEAVSPTFVP